MTPRLHQAARVIVEKYYGKLTLDFQVNKKITEEPSDGDHGDRGEFVNFGVVFERRYRMKINEI